MDEIKDVNEIVELLESKQYTVLRQRLSEKEKLIKKLTEVTNGKAVIDEKEQMFMAM